MKIWQIMTVSAAAAVALPALAQVAPPSSGMQSRADVEARVRGRLGKLDTDKNGTVTRDEMMAVAEARTKARNEERFAAMDADKNGSISRAEFDAHHKGGMRTMGHAGMSHASMDHASMDHGKGHGDRVVHIERRRIAGPERAPGADTKPIVKERTRVLMGGRNGMLMADGDGKGIVIADAVKQALERFDAADTDKNGQISPEERKARRGMWRTKIG